jgi:hypothetical protein
MDPRNKSAGDGFLNFVIAALVAAIHGWVLSRAAARP